MTRLPGHDLVAVALRDEEARSVPGNPGRGAQLLAMDGYFDVPIALNAENAAVSFPHAFTVRLDAYVAIGDVHRLVDSGRDVVEMHSAVRREIDGAQGAGGDAIEDADHGHVRDPQFTAVDEHAPR